MSLQTSYCNQPKLAARDKQPVNSCFRHVAMTQDLLPFWSVQMHFCRSFLHECCCHLGPSAAVLRLQLNMSSSYAAAISALLSTSSSKPVKPSPHPFPGTARSSKPSPEPIKHPHHPPAVQIHPQAPEALGSYEEQQENPEDYGIGRQRANAKHQHAGWDLFFDTGGTLCCRWVLPRWDWRDFCWPLPSGQKVGMGSLLYCVALLGYGVSSGLVVGPFINNIIP